MYCVTCKKELQEPQDVCCDKVYIRRKDEAVIIVNLHTADVMVVKQPGRATKFEIGSKKMAKFEYLWEENKPEIGEDIYLKIKENLLWLSNKDEGSWINIELTKGDKLALLKTLLRDFLERQLGRASKLDRRE